MTHFDDWILQNLYNPNPEFQKAAGFFVIARLPVVEQVAVSRVFKKPRLLCIYQGEQFRCTGASRLGDIWLTRNFDQEHGYELRVAVDHCSDWSLVS